MCWFKSSIIVCSLFFVSLVHAQTLILDDEGVGQGTVRELDCVGENITCTRSSIIGTITVLGGAAGAPTDATYWVGAGHAGLSAEINLGALGTGLVLNTGGIPSTLAGNACAANNFTISISASGVLSCAQPLFSNLSGSATDAQIPNNITIDLSTTATALAANGGNCSGNNFALGVDASGVGECAQPAFSNLSGSATDAQVPNTITLDNLTQITTRAIGDTTGTLAVGRGGSGQTTLTTNQLYIGTALDTLTAKTLPSCSNGTTSKLLFNSSTQEFSCGTDQGGAGGFSVTETEIDFGDAGVFFDGVFTVTDAAISAASKIMVSQSGAAATSREQDENEMDGLILRAAPGSGEFTLYVTCPESCHGKFKVHYAFS